MSEVSRIANLVKRAHDGDAWHGPSLRDAVAGVDARRAAARPIGAAHSIWELVLHVSGWNDVVRRRVEGEPITEPEEGDWPEVADTSEAAWQRAVDDLARRSAALHEAIAKLDDAALDKRVQPNGSTGYENLHGIVHHMLYHAGQISILKKAE